MDKKPFFIMMIGLPGSGKSERAKHIAEKYNMNIHSSDTIREEISPEGYNPELNDQVFTILHNRIKEDLINGKGCIYDACNISYKRRRHFLSQLKNIDCHKVCELIATPYEVCLEQNTARKAVVPEKVIENMYRSFDIPGYYEGWDNICIHYNDESYETFYGKSEDFITDTLLFEQENKFHKDTLGMHCVKCALNAYKFIKDLPEKLDFESEIRYASLIHDCGKPFCKTFVNAKGETTDNAHYYNHERVGSYNSLFYDVGDTDKHYMSLLIRWHMIMHAIYTEYSPKLEKKYGNLLGKEMFDDLYLLYKSDSMAH